MQHDDLLGEAVCPEEADVVQRSIMVSVLGPKAEMDQPFFPGSQPVSLARSNLELLNSRRYWVGTTRTWHSVTDALAGLCMPLCYAQLPKP